MLYDAFDALGHDAVAHEEQDACGGHPDQSSTYHYHAITSCIADAPDAIGHSALMGYALDGFGIYGNLGTGGTPMTDATLDACHGHTHAVLFHAATQVIYHYHATIEFPIRGGRDRGGPSTARLRAPLGMTGEVVWRATAEPLWTGARNVGRDPRLQSRPLGVRRPRAVR